MVEESYAFVKSQMQEKKVKTSFLSQAIKSLGTNASMEHLHKWSAASMYLGGSDTTVASFMAFFLVMPVFLEVQKRAQEELDRVVGGERLPVTSDKANLPYIEAVMKEAHRWHTVAPMALSY
jgi:cytochrome P450